MTEQATIPLPEQPKKTGSSDKILNMILTCVIVVGAIFLIAEHPQMAWKIFLVLVGFGAVIFIHELGHFLMAKLCGIKVEVFSIGFPPVLVSFRKLKKGYRIQFMPKSDTVETLEEGDAETQYTVGAVPFGGFVKMLGQSDSGAVEKSDDPRSFLNKPIWQRIVVVAGGVAFNAIGAMILFMVLFMHGIKLMPAVVGEVLPDSPAAVAGLKPGDRMVEIDGEKFVDYTTVILSAALSDKDRGVKVKVERAGTPSFETTIVASKPVNSVDGIRVFGFSQPGSLKVSDEIQPQDIDAVYKAVGMYPGDTVTAVNGKPVTQAWQFDEMVSSTLLPSMKVTLSRTYKEASAKAVDLEVPLFCAAVLPNFRNEYDLANIYSMVPRLKITSALEEAKKSGFQDGDIILKVGDVDNPTYKDLREKVEAFKDKELPVVVLRKDKDGKEVSQSLSAMPKTRRGGKQAAIGVVLELDMEHPVVAHTIDIATGPGAVGVPSGAVITAVDGQPVSSFYDVIRLIRANGGQRISIDFRNGQETGGTGLDVPEREALHIQSTMAKTLPLEYSREVFKASNPAQAITWGVVRTKQNIMSSVVTLMRLFSNTVPASSLSGPVGIATISYKMAGQGLLDLLNFLGLVSSCLVVMNLLPLPIVDGGLIVLLIIEKFRGVPLSVKTQEIITWIGLGFLLSVFVWVTYNDIYRLLTIWR